MKEIETNILKTTDNKLASRGKIEHRQIFLPFL